MKFVDEASIKVEAGKKVTLLARTKGINEEQFNALGEEGWELVSVLQFDIGGTQLGAIFKRGKKA